jgi:hypothetical protein
MGVGVLRRMIGFEGVECPEVTDDIDLPVNFNYMEYKKEIRNLFEVNRRYRTKNNNARGDVETEDEMIEQSVADLCDIIKIETKTKQNDKYIISKVKLRILLEKHSLSRLNSYVVQFIRHIQDMVSDTYFSREIFFLFFFFLNTPLYLRCIPS